jgi:gamma-glutamylcyclotransferase (GGCT)/AIG2-like uncharacterized protein YtfP
MDVNYYFAYGSNMLLSQMKERCPDSKFVGRAYILGYKFVYDGYSKSRNCAVANIVEVDNSIVLGGLYKISEKDLKSLDRFEGYPSSYNRKIIKVILDNKREVDGYTYFRVGEPLGLPTDEYRDLIKKGAYDCNLPEDYISGFIKK